MRLEGHLDYLAEPKHLSGKLMRSGSGGAAGQQRSSSRSSGGLWSTGGSGKLRGAPSRSASGGGKSGVPMLALGGLQPPAPRGHGRSGSRSSAVRRGEDDDLDGFAGWAASHGSSLPAPAHARVRGGGSDYGDYESDYRGGNSDYGGGGLGNAGWASAVLRTSSPTPPHLRPPRAPSPPMPWERASAANLSSGTAQAASMRLASPTRGRLPPAVDPAARATSPMRPPHAQPAPLEPEIRLLMTVLSSPHAASTHRAMGQSSARIPTDYYARLDEVASLRRLTRSQTFN